MPMIWINEQLIDEEDARISVRDLGLLHAAGVFTTMRAHGGAAERLDAHLARVRASCEALSLPLPYEDAELAQAVGSLLQVNELSDARLRLTVTRGETIVDPEQGPAVRPTVFVTAALLEPHPAELYERGMTVLAYDQFKLNPYDPQAGHKTLDYFSRLGALREAQRRGANEALLFSVHNFLQSGAISNAYVVQDGKLITPPTNDEIAGDETIRTATRYPRGNVLPGITRAAILGAAAAASITVERRAVTIDDVLSADELFLSNSIMGVMPVCRVERKAIGNEKPGEVTRKLSAAIGAEVKR